MAKGKRTIKGLGDVVKAVTDAVGIEQCEGCKERQFTLNRSFTFKKPNKQITDTDKERLKNPDEKTINELYITYFGLDNSGCYGCKKVVETMLNDLNKLAQWESLNT